MADAFSYKGAWVEHHDKLMGPYWVRVVRTNGECFRCGNDIRDNILAWQCYRGQTKWLEHEHGDPTCIINHKKKKK